MALGPRPRLNLTRFHGVFAPNCGQREHVVPKREPKQPKTDKPLARMTWMQRLKPVFAIDIETCPKCDGKLRVIACIKTSTCVLHPQSEPEFTSIARAAQTTHPYNP